MRYTRHDEVPVYEHRDGVIDARYFNHVTTALKRSKEKSLRFPIPKLKHLDLILQDDAWVIVDRVLNDVPVAAWVEFRSEHRTSLHEPIKCRIRYFHAYAGMILRRTLEAMDELVNEELTKDLPDNGSKIVPLKREE